MSERRNTQLEQRAAELARALDLFQQCQEDEYRALALDIHDELEPTLSAMLQQIRALRAAGVPLQAQKNLDALGLLANTALDDVRRIARILRPAVLENKGLLPALAWFCEQFTAQTGIACTYTCSVEMVSFPQKSELMIYRILQEAFNNIYQHAGAEQAQVSVHRESGQFVLKVQDNGCGFDPAAVKERVGLVGMAERACMLGGRLTVTSAPGKGTLVTLECRDSGAAEEKPLTEREIEVLRYVARGYTSKEIGQRLFLSARTVESHRMRLMRKLDAKNRSELVEYAMKQGLI